VTTLREETCLEIHARHKEEKSLWYPEPCQCPWCRKARTILARVEVAQ